MFTTYRHGSSIVLGPVARSLVSANRWLRSIKMYRFPWYLTLVSTNHASSNPGLVLKILRNYKVSTRRHYKLRLIALKKELRTNRLRAMWAFCRTSVKGICFCNILNILESSDK